MHKLKNLHWDGEGAMGMNEGNGKMKEKNQLYYIVINSDSSLYK